MQHLLALLCILHVAGHASAFVGINPHNVRSALPQAAKVRASSSAVSSWRMEEEETAVSRRKAMLLAGGAVLSAAWNSDSALAADTSPVITAKAYFDIKIVGRTKALENAKWEKIIARDKRAGGAGTGDQVKRIVFGLYGKEAPDTVDAFVKLVKGELAAPCIDEDEVVDNEAFGVSERTKLTKRQIYRQCKAQEVAQVGYQYSQVYRVVKGKFTGLGRLNKLYRQPPRHDDANALKHDAPGLLTAVKGGGEFEFLDVMDFLNNAPVTQGQFLEGAFKLTGKAIGDVRAGVSTKERPLQKMSVVECGLL